MKHPLTSVASVLTLVLSAGTALAATTYYAPTATTVVTPSSGDVNATVPPGSTVIVPAETGRMRTPETVNPAGSGAQVHTDNYDADPDADSSYSNTPTAETGANGATYVSGGIGIHGKEQIEALAHDYRLKLTFATNTGHFLADVDVTITDKAGATIVQTTTKGPILLVNLPAGTYTVTSSYEGVTKTQKAVVGAAGLKSYSITYTQPVT